MRNQSAGRLRQILEKLNPVYEDQFIEIAELIAQESNFDNSLMQEEVDGIRDQIEFFKAEAPRPTMTNKETEKKIANIIRENITFSGQIGDYVIHGAIEAICKLIDDNNRAWGNWHEQFEYASLNKDKTIESQAKEIERLKAYLKSLRDSVEIAGEIRIQALPPFFKMIDTILNPQTKNLNQ